MSDVYVISIPVGRRTLHDLTDPLVSLPLADDNTNSPVDRETLTVETVVHTSSILTWTVPKVVNSIATL